MSTTSAGSGHSCSRPFVSESTTQTRALLRRARGRGPPVGSTSRNWHFARPWSPRVEFARVKGGRDRKADSADDFHLFLHELRTRELERLPPGAKVVLSGGAA